MVLINLLCFDVRQLLKEDANFNYFREYIILKTLKYR